MKSKLMMSKNRIMFLNLAAADGCGCVRVVHWPVGWQRLER